MFAMEQEMYAKLPIIKRTSIAEDSLDRRYIQQLGGNFSTASTEQPIENHQPGKGATPIATQHRSIYFDPASAHMSLDSPPVVDEIAGQLRAYQNPILDTEATTNSPAHRGATIQLSR